MKNAHLRFGHLLYTRVLKKGSTRFKVTLDRFVAEAEQGNSHKAHLISVIGGDTQIAAIAAAISSNDSFTVQAPDGREFHVTLGAKAECFRSSLQLAVEKRPVRHLLGVSEELAQTGTGTPRDRTILFDSSPRFVWMALAQIHGLPGMPEWAEWVVEELKRMKAVEPLAGIGCDPVLIKGAKGLFMNCLSRGLRSGALRFPETNGPIQWNTISLAQLL